MSDLNSQYIIAQEEHDYNKKYEEGTIVKHTIDDVTTAYIAKQNVPQFISILNEKYWKKIASTEEGGTVDYDNLKNKPAINGVKLDGNKTSQDLGVYSKPSSGIPQSDLEQDVQTSLGKADTAYQKPQTGIPESDLSSDVQQALQKHFKGWYDSSSNLPANPVIGDYAYVKGAETTDPAAIYECTTDGSWSDSGMTADTSNVQTFASSQEVNEVHIVNDCTTGGTYDVLSAEQGKILNQQSIFSGNLLTKENGTSLNGYYINYGAEVWNYTDIHTDTAFVYSVSKGNIIKIKNNDNYAVYMLITNATPVLDASVDVIKKGRVDNEEYIIIPEDCYLYVLNWTTNNDIVRWPAEIKNTASSSNFASQENINHIIKDYGVESKFYIQGSTSKWKYATTAKSYYFNVLNGDKIKITANPTYSATIAFIKPFAKYVNIDDIAEFSNQFPAYFSITEGTSQEFTLTEDCILFVFETSTNPNINRYPANIQIENRVYAGTSKPELKFIEGSYSFLGEVPNFVKNTFNRSSLLTLPAWGNYKSTTGVGLHQGMAVYGDYIVLFTYSDSVSPSATKLGLIRLSTQELLATIDIPYSTYSRPHGNMLSFGTVFNSQNSVVPLLYVSQWEQSSEHGCLVYDITLTESTYSANLVQAIIPNNMDGTKFGNGCTDWCVDAENNYLYSVSYMLADDGSSTEDNETNPTMICKFEIPSITEILEKTLTTSDILDNFSLESMPLRQSGCIANNKLIIIRGAMNSYPASWCKAHFIDLLTKQITTQISLIPFGGEPEGVSIYNDKLVMGWRNDANLYQFSFYG